ncbi:MAG: response regulator [Ignavibacteriae bacterium]|nr:response regulator [Ignavibacteriota bacterium]
MNEGQQLICVIEDNNSVRKLYNILLKKSNYNVVEFEDGNPAIEWLSKNSPTAVICDDLLPDTNGKEMLAAIRQLPNGKKLPVIAITGFAHAADRERYFAMGFDGYIAKPINTSAFVDEIRQIINSKK